MRKWNKIYNNNAQVMEERIQAEIAFKNSMRKEAIEKLDKELTNITSRMYYKENAYNSQKTYLGLLSVFTLVLIGSMCFCPNVYIRLIFIVLEVVDIYLILKLIQSMSIINLSLDRDRERLTSLHYSLLEYGDY